MSGEQDLIKLYSGKILSLAASIPLTERLENPDGTARRRSALCGSSVAVDVMVQSGRIKALGQDVKACALGQASASVVASNAVGRTLLEIRTARDQLCQMLSHSGPAPEKPFDELGVLIPARDYKNRHASIMLAIEATLEAFESAENQSIGP